MNEITHINQTQQSIRIFSIGSHSFFIEDSENSGTRDKKVRIAYQLGNGEIIYVPE